jgi:hypothetical protein
MYKPVRVALLLMFAAVAQARPVTIEPLSTFATPDGTYASFGDSVAVDGDYALASAERVVPDPGGDPFMDQVFSTAFLFQRNGSRWLPVRQLQETQQDPEFPIAPAVAMRNGLAAAQTARTDIWELGATGWTRAPAELSTDGPGTHLAIDGGRVISGDGTGPWSARVFEKDADGTWKTAAVLRGKLRGAGSDDEFRGGAADISGPWAVVMQPNGEDDPVPEVFVYHDYGAAEGGWNPNPFGGARPPEGASRFGDEVAIRWPDVFVAGGNESGTYVYRDVPAQGLHLATRAQAVDSFMGSGVAGAFARNSRYLLQQAWSFDRQASVINVFARQADGSFEHVAVLAAKKGESLGRAIALSDRRVLAGGNGNGLVYYFVIPEETSAPPRILDTFASGDGDGWTTSSGSAFGTVRRGVTRVYRQSESGVEARAVLDDSDYASQAIDADLRTIDFAGASSGVGLTTRWQGPDNFFEAVIRNNGRAELRRMASGGIRVLTSAAFKVLSGHNYHLRFESIGTLHRLFVDGKLLLDADSSGPTHGRAALVTDHARAEFDNVVVSPTLISTIYRNDFERDAGPWSFAGLGFWNLRALGSGVWSQSSIAGDARASVGVPTDDQVVRVRARLDTFASPVGTQERWFGVMARHVDDRNFYYLSLRSSNTVSLRKMIDDSSTTLAQATFTVTPGAWYQLRLDVVGKNLRAYVNGTLLLEASDDSLPRGNSGPVMFKAATDFDDFCAYQP